MLEGKDKGLITVTCDGVQCNEQELFDYCTIAEVLEVLVSNCGTGSRWGTTMVKGKTYHFCPECKG